LPGQDVSSVAFHAGGKRLTTVSADGTVVLWDPVTGRRLRTLRAHLGPVMNIGFNVGFSADGERFTTLDKDGTAQVWETASGRKVAGVAQHPKLPLTAFLSPDGTRLAIAHFGLIELVEVKSGKTEAVLTNSFHGVPHLAFSADGRRLAAAVWDGKVKVWDIKTKKLLHTFRHADRATCVAFHPNGRQLASGGCDNVARVWDLKTGKEVETLRGHIGYVGPIAYSRDGKLLATASGHRYAGEVQLWETATFGKKR